MYLIQKFFSFGYLYRRHTSSYENVFGRDKFFNYRNLSLNINSQKPEPEPHLSLVHARKSGHELRKS